MNSTRLATVAILLAAGLIAGWWWYTKRAPQQPFAVSPCDELEIEKTERECLACCDEKYKPDSDPVELANCVDQCTGEVSSQME